MALIWGGPHPSLPAVRFSTEQATQFARYVVARFGAFQVLWSLSGDAPYVHELDKWEAVGAAVEAADLCGHPTTNHLSPSMNWHFLFHDSPWHDFHMLQTGHRRGSISDIADLPLAYYKREPTKACVNGEPWYEAHPSRHTKEYGPAFAPSEARYAFWVSMLSGATMGHTYGSQGLWNWKRQGDGDAELGGAGIGPVWSDALGHTGAGHCALGARLLRTLPWWQLQPCPERAQFEPSPAECTRRPRCAAAPGSAWVTYLPGGAGHVIPKGLEPINWRARWFDPRTAEEHPVGAVELGIDRKWRAPLPPTTDDWVLVLSAEQD